jgi:protein O-mannose beta-1,4-N-acetylglucosaminyltransferase
MVGIPRDRFDPALLDLSSIENHNAQYFNFIDMPSWASEKLLIGTKIVHTTSLIFNRFHSNNIMHVMHDDLLPLYTTLRMINGETPSSLSPFDIQLMFADNYEDGEFIDLYLKFTNHTPLSRHKMDHIHATSLCFSNVYVGLNKHSTWYQYGFFEPQGPLPHVTVTAQDIKHFTRYFTNQILNIEVGHPKDLVVLISRKDTRLIVNEMDLCLTLAKHLDKKVISISMETHSMTDIVDSLSRAMLMIGMHGSLMIFSMFLPQGAIVLELFPYGINPEHYTPYKTLAKINGLNLFYRSWSNSDISKTITYPDRSQQLGGIRHLTIEQQTLIENSDEIATHLCCSDPAWLFRINQDTVVNLDEILQLINSGLQDRQKYMDQSISVNLNNQKDQMNSRYMKYPSEIQNIHCNCSCTKNNQNSEHCSPRFHCQWNYPWNLKYIEDKASSISYEVWIQMVGEENYKSYILSGTEISLTEGFHADSEYYVWIRAMINEANGPFTFKTCHTN